MKSKKKKKYFTSKYKISMRELTTSQEVWHVFTTRLRLLIFCVLAFFVLLGGVFVLVMYTPISDFLPGYPGSSAREKLQHSIVKLDSLNREVALFEGYVAQIQLILDGKTLESTLQSNDSLKGGTHRTITSRSIEDSLLRAAVQAASQKEGETTVPEYSKISFEMISPIEAAVVQEFSPEDGNFGVVLSPKPNSVVLSVLDGTVLQSGWTAQDGYTMTIQHGGSMVTIYKGLQSVLKGKGDRVKAAEGIGISEVTSVDKAPTLTFELWSAANPVDPQNYISFSETASENTP